MAKLPPRIKVFRTHIGFSDVVVATSRARVDSAWQALEARGTASIFQSRGFLSAWAQTSAESGGETLLYVAAHQGATPVLMLPLALTRLGGARVLTWAAQAHANYGMGLFHPDLLASFNAGARDIDALILAMACRSKLKTQSSINVKAAQSG